MVNIPIYTRGEDLERSGNPLRKFAGRFIGSGDDPEKMVIFQHTVEGRQTPVVDLNFLNVDPKSVVCIVPYNYPTAQITINYRTLPQSGKPSERGGWGLLLQSLKELNYVAGSGFHHQPGDDNYGLEDVLGQDLAMEMEPDHDYGTNNEGQQMAGPVWRVTAVTSGGGSTPDVSVKEAALAILGEAGMERTAFTEAALESATLRTISAAIMDGSFIAGLIADGSVKEEDGVFKPA